MIDQNHSKFIAALFLGAAIAVPSCSAFAEAPTSSKASGRYVALQPPSAGDKTYANFLWVLDTATGKVVAYRISSLEDAQGNHEAWVTEQLLTDIEYARIYSSKDK